MLLAMSIEGIKNTRSAYRTQKSWKWKWKWSTRIPHLKINRAFDIEYICDGVKHWARLRVSHKISIFIWLMCFKYRLVLLILRLMQTRIFSPSINLQTVEQRKHTPFRWHNTQAKSSHFVKGEKKNTEFVKSHRF